jgi:hypothetical protein
MLDLLIEAPTQAEVEEEDYERELELSDANNQGRSKVTGY